MEISPSVLYLELTHKRVGSQQTFGARPPHTPQHAVTYQLHTTKQLNMPMRRHTLDALFAIAARFEQGAFGF